MHLATQDAHLLNCLGGKSQKQFLQEAIERSSPGNARFLAELFGGLELNLELGDGAQVPISFAILN